MAKKVSKIDETKDPALGLKGIKEQEPTLSPDQYIKTLNKAVDEQRTFTCEYYIDALPIQQEEKAKLYNDAIKIVRCGEPPRDNPFSK